MNDSTDNSVQDFFISYTQSDREWAEWLGWELEEAGYSVLLQAWDMPAGSRFVHVMDRALRHTRRTLLVLSPAYLNSDFGEAEWRPGFKDDPSGEHGRLLPVRVQPCEPEGLLADLVWIDLVGLDEAAARAKLLTEVASALQGRGRPSARPRFPQDRSQTATGPRFPAPLPPTWNLPFHRNQTFTGREQLLERLAGRSMASGSPITLQVLQGGGGVGKTALTTEYAYRQRGQFDTVWWVNAGEPATLVSDYAELAAAVGLDEAGLRDQQVVATAVRRWLEGHERWLLILDNAGGPDTPTGFPAPLAHLVDLLPRLVRGQILISSRDASWEQHADGLVDVEPFTPAEATRFLLNRSGSTDDRAAAEVVELLGYLPLALEQAGAYAREACISLEDYLERLRRFPAMTLGKGHPRDHDPEDTVAGTWVVSLEQVRAVPGAVALLELCAFLAPEEVPRGIFAQKLSPPPDELAVLGADPFALDEAIGSLRRYGLVKADDAVLIVHRLLQQVVRGNLDPRDAAARAGSAVRLLGAAFPSEPYHDTTTWPACTRLLSHVLAATEHAERFGVEPAERSRLLARAASYLHGRARYDEAKALFQRALTLARATFGPDHPETGVRLNDLGFLLLRVGDPAAARPHLARALALLPDDHPMVATILDNLGQTLHDLGDLEGARLQLERALAIKQTLLGPHHATVGITIANLGNVLRDQNDLTGARQHHEQALEIIKTALGPDHPYVGITLIFMGVACRDFGDLAGGRKHLERAHSILRSTLGPAHPRTQRAGQRLAELAQPSEGPAEAS